MLKRKSLEPYLLFISRRYFKSLSPSNNKASDDASKLKFLENKKDITIIIERENNVNL